MPKKEKIFFPIVVGTNHRFSELSFRDRLFIEESLVSSFLLDIKNSGFNEAMLVSTCDRIDIFCVHDNISHSFEVVTKKLAEHANATPEKVRSVLYQYVGFEAIEHIFKVSASLDSAVIGEPQILGQMKVAHRLAQEADCMGKTLELIMQSAYACAKRARTETAIGERSISILSAAIDLAHDVFGDLGRTEVLLIGIGYMGELLANELLGAGVKKISVIDLVNNRAKTIVKRINGHLADFNDLEHLMEEADIIVSAVGTRKIILSKDIIKRSLLARRRRQQLILDVAVPGDVEPSVNNIENIFLYDLLDLERVAMEGQLHRESEFDAASSIVKEEAKSFICTQAERAAIPVVTMLRNQFEAERLRVLVEAKGDADKATRLLINRLLHKPTMVLKNAAVNDSYWIEGVRWIERLFNLSGVSYDRENDE